MLRTTRVWVQEGTLHRHDPTVFPYPNCAACKNLMAAIHGMWAVWFVSGVTILAVVVWWCLR